MICYHRPKDWHAHILSFGTIILHLSQELFVQDVLHRDELDEAPSFLAERFGLVLGVGGKPEGDHETFLPFLAGHDAFELVDVGPSARFSSSTPAE